MVEGIDILDEARKVARKDGDKCLEQFERCALIPARLKPKGGTIRYSRDFSMPEHSVLVVIVRAGGDHHYTLGIVRHQRGDDLPEWSAHS